MEITFDPDKCAQTLTARGLGFARAGEIFEGHHFTAPDLRRDCGEDRYITVGTLDGL